jgi:2-methylcitrate synthase/citrate synthase II
VSLREYSPGLEGVVAGETAISSLEGGLSYRGYSIEELAHNASFEEVAHLLLHGELPKVDQLATFRRRLAMQEVVPPPILESLRRIPPKVPMMDVMRSGASLLAHWENEVADNSHDANVRKAERLLVQLPILMAARHRLLQGKEPVAADPRRSFAENVLWMLLRTQPTPAMTRAMDVSLILYAEHEFNASTFTARVIASTLSDLHSSICGAIGALKGPLHGGANERVLAILQTVGSADKAEAWVMDALAKKQRIMGFGHRVYKDGDPRAAYVKTMCSELAAQTGHSPMEELADTIEAVVWREKKLPPNVDWPTARLYHYFGLEVELYTPLFVVARTAGWCAHVIEQLDENRLIRPAANYTGPAARGWKDIGERG